MIKQLRQTIESHRYSRQIFWRVLILLKDFLWAGWINGGTLLHTLFIKTPYREYHTLKQRICLKKITKEKIPSNRSEIRLFMVVRNEMLRLPYLFTYYKNMGVDRFFIIDNDSHDDTLSFVLSQDNTHVFSTHESYGKARSGHMWIRFLLNTYGQGHWCLLVDADELFVYPHYENMPLKNFCRFLDEHNADALSAMLLDMYANQPMHLTEYSQGQDPLSVFEYFDKDTHICHPNPVKNYSNPFLHKGGMRKRVFDVDAWLTKVPLFKFKKSMRLYQGQHFITHAKLSDIQGALLHFKYSSDFIHKVRQEAQREEYSRNAEDYKAYTKKVSECNVINPYYCDSIKFEDSAQLVEAGIMTSSHHLEKKLTSY